MGPSAVRSAAMSVDDGESPQGGEASASRTYGRAAVVLLMFGATAAYAGARSGPSRLQLRLGHDETLAKSMVPNMTTTLAAAADDDGGSGSSGVEEVLSASEDEALADCRNNDTITLYKYTITSSLATEDGEWADLMFGCDFRNVTATHDCAELGKTSCFSTTLAFGLHFVENKVTAAGSIGIKEWDEYQLSLNANSFDADEYNGFMHFSLALYAPDLTSFVKYLGSNGVKFLARRGESPLDDLTWYTIVVQSPSGKVFEVTSTVLDDSALNTRCVRRAGRTWTRKRGWSAIGGRRRDTSTRAYPAEEIVGLGAVRVWRRMCGAHGRAAE